MSNRHRRQLGGHGNWTGRCHGLIRVGGGQSERCRRQTARPDSNYCEGCAP